MADFESEVLHEILIECGIKHSIDDEVAQLYPATEAEDRTTFLKFLAKIKDDNLVAYAYILPHLQIEIERFPLSDSEVINKFKCFMIREGLL